MHRAVRTIPFACVTLLSLLFSATFVLAADNSNQLDPEQQARQIIETSGVQGGLVVHVGCGDGELTTALRINDRYVVHGLEADTAKVMVARKIIDAQGAYGPVAVMQWTPPQLPYAENLVNLLIVDTQGVSEAEMRRVLAPLGVAMIREGEGWRKVVKPYPSNIGSWTHFMQDASGNAVAHDQVIGPPERLQWDNGPIWCRSHQIPSSINCAVTDSGRLFAIIDEAPIGVYKNLPPRCNVVARDAANGVLLWRQPLHDWDTEHGGGEGDRWHIHQTLPRRLVAQGDRVYVTLAIQNAPVSVLDAATGKILVQALPGTEKTDELICDNGILVAKLTDHSPEATEPIFHRDLQGSLVAIDLKTNKLLWRKSDANVAPYALAMADGCVVYHDASAIYCLDAKTGKQLWKDANDEEKIQASGNTLVINDGVVLYHSRFRRDVGAAKRKNKGKETKPHDFPGPLLTAFSLADGKKLWSAPGDLGLAGASNIPTEIFVIKGQVWCGGSPRGLDLHTGEIKQTLNVGDTISIGHHYRCYPGKATDCYLIYPKRGAEFMGLEGQPNMRTDWLRASCYTGMLPANGLLYVPPSQCFCYPGVKLAGFLALAPAAKDVGSEKQAAEKSTVETRLQVSDLPPLSAAASAHTADSNSDWPMYRHDALRSGATRSKLSTGLAKAWEVSLTTPAAQPVVVGNRVFIAEKDAHHIHCLSMVDGRELWSFVAGGRIDSAPTSYEGLLLFGSHDGWVYCLREADGALVWRFRAAPHERLVMSYDQVESAWPVHGSVLVQNDVVYFAAGRSSFLDGGITIYALNPHTGAVLHQAQLEGPQPDVANDPGGPFSMEGAKSDLLVSDGKDLYMMRVKFDPTLTRLETPQLTGLGDLDQGGRHLIATGGFLDDSGFDRLFWMHASRWPGFYFSQQAPKSGQQVVFDKHRAYAIKYFYQRNSLSPLFTPGAEGYLLYADKIDNDPTLVGKDRKPAALEWLPKSAGATGRYAIGNVAVDVEKGVGFSRSQPALWQTMVPVRGRAMLLTADALLLAGPPDVVDPKDPLSAFEGRKGALLQIFKPTDGKLVTELSLPASPVFDGMSCAKGRLFIATTDGKVVCFTGRRR